ncbi:MAG: hypothetical protein A3C58_00730 [Candidatus Staskawiczbacteria bacterium RIFCSPHIGHO2_02_FULL_34_10]|uniref:Pseudouridine synthase RsuA/RluA-like domain-containing protein n=1 Tax=Candidatus Staskawiczbacteria bacterium RIFCSPHIGHO2_02_FULL_34_10 TaxID=1802205 RepID=A0A1G2HXW9_9BACT|nr:MAG: hypothetical protein A3C58_00730 [Candidatus Staskawiczbacteria bacterium RIFCSPHIGHO2_02_FULL_34_10]
MSNVKVLYEDNHIIVVFKPAGVLSQGDKTGDVSMYDMVKDYIKETKAQKFQRNFVLGRALNALSALEYKKTGNVFLGLIHRLDRPVSGIMLFAKTSKGASRLSEQFINHTIEKNYHALVIGKPNSNKGVLINKLGKDSKLLKAKNYLDGVEVKLYYEVVKSNEIYSLLKIKIEGGKFHQIRAQLSIAGFPILGDIKYKGGSWDNKEAIALCATELSFKAATEEKIINLAIGLPKEWKNYLSTESLDL